MEDNQSTGPEQNQIVAPGGVRDAATVHIVPEGQTVLETPAGSFVTNGSPDETFMVTPGGHRRRSLVHHIEPGTSLDGDDLNLKKIHSDGSTLRAFGKLSRHSADRPLMPANVTRKQDAVRSAAGVNGVEAVAPANFISDWITYAAWTNNTGSPITSFSTTWEVPPAPISRTVAPGDRHIIFLFNGIQNRDMIYQPVLQWGHNGEGGGDYWTVASWYADGQNGPAFHSNWVRVNPGQTITGLMSLTGRSGNKFSYNCEFVGIPGTSLPITNVEELTYCIQTLECYGITGASSYPPTFCTAMKGISISTGSEAHPSINWQPINRVQDCGQHTMVVSNANPNGEVDLCYGTGAPASISAASWAPGSFTIFGLGTDDQIWQKSWLGSAWDIWRGLGGVYNSPITAVSWGRGRMDLFGLGTDNKCYHKAWAGQWLPSVNGAEFIDGTFISPVNAVSWGVDRLDLFGVSLDAACWHKSWDGSWHGWESLGGKFNSPVTAVSWSSNRLDLFGLGTDNQCYHKWWDGARWWDWEPLGGIFNSNITAVTLGVGRLDLFGLGTDNSMYHKSYNNGWSGWIGLGGTFRSMPTAVSWGSNRLEVFAIGVDNAMYRKSWVNGAWKTTGFESLGGIFNSAPTAICSAPDRIDVFGLGSNNAMYHKRITDTGVGASGSAWEGLGGTFDHA